MTEADLQDVVHYTRYDAATRV